MTKSGPIFGFFMTYIGLILICFLAYFYLYPNIFNTAEGQTIFSYAVSVASLTHTNVPVIGDSNIGFIVFSVIVTQISGVLFLSYLLYYCRQLFGTAAEKAFGLFRAFKDTIVVTLIVEAGLFIFYIYGIPMDIAGGSLNNKVLSALSMSINSFNNAGFSWWMLIIEDGFLSQNFFLQIGAIGGTVIGSLGIYAIYDLFSPKKLRERLENPFMDWSFITKASLFGAALILASGSFLFYMLESNYALKETNIMEAVFASIYEICAFRGFGFSLFDLSELSTTYYLGTFISILGGGPFSTAGGLTVLIFTGFMFLFYKKEKRSASQNTAISLSKNLLYYHLIWFNILFVLMLLIKSELSWQSTFLSQIAAFTTTHLDYTASGGGHQLIQITTVIFGRVGFIVACFLTVRSHKS